MLPRYAAQDSLQQTLVIDRGVMMRLLDRMKTLLFMMSVLWHLLGCTSVSLYRGPDEASEAISVLKVVDERTSISNVDGQATVSPIGYAFKGMFKKEITLLPGKHEIIFVHGERKTVSSKAIYELLAKHGTTYLVQSKTVDRSTAIWIEEEQSKEKVGRILATYNEPLMASSILDSFSLFSFSSFSPPHGSGWAIQKREGDSLTLFRAGPNEDESFVIEVVSGPMPTFRNEKEFIDAVDKKRIEKLAATSKRFKNIESRIDPANPFDFCFDTYALAEDHAAVRESSRKDMMLIETASRTCRHPSNHSVAINIYYSHRYYPGGRDLQFIDRAENAFRSLKYK